MSAHLRATIAGLTLLLASILAPAQSDKRYSLSQDQHASDDLLARVSYRSTYVMNWSDSKSPRVCFALYRSGRYQLLKVAKGKNEVLEGTLSQDELSSIGKMLNNLDPKKSGRGVVIQKGSESLVAQLVRGEDTESYNWIDPDHHLPFPTAALRIVNWLQNFKARGASPLMVLHEMPEFSICPPPSITPVPIASLMRTRGGSACDPKSR